jgi:hypothetical protein
LEEEEKNALPTGSAAFQHLSISAFQLLPLSIYLSATLPPLVDLSAWERNHGFCFAMVCQASCRRMVRGIDGYGS